MMGDRKEVLKMVETFKSMIKTFKTEIMKIQEFLNRHDREIADLRARVDALEQR